MLTRFALAALTLAAVATPAAAQTWKIDTAHSTARFTVRHMMVSNVHGSFGKVEGTVVFDEHRRAARDGGAAHSRAHRDAHARRLALERPEDEFVRTPAQVESRPVQISHGVPDQRGGVGEVRGRVALVAEQRRELGAQIGVHRLAVGARGRQGEHRLSIPGAGGAADVRPWHAPRPPQRPRHR